MEAKGTLMNKWVYLSLMVLFLIAVFSSGLEAEEKRTTLGFTTRAGGSSLPFVIGEEKGFFKAEGLNTAVVIMQNQVVVNGVLSRSVDYGGTFRRRASAPAAPST